jgi:hypothetical protein
MHSFCQADHMLQESILRSTTLAGGKEWEFIAHGARADTRSKSDTQQNRKLLVLHRLPPSSCEVRLNNVHRTTSHMALRVIVECQRFITFPWPRRDERLTELPLTPFPRKEPWIVLDASGCISTGRLTSCCKRV